MVSGSGVGPLIEVKESMNQNSYIDLLRNHFLLFSAENLASGWVLQRDNAPCHKSKKVLQLFEANKIDLIDWPAQTLHLIPIENIWGIIKAKIRKEKPKNLKDLKCKIVETCSKIPNDLCLKLIHSMPNRLAEDIKNKGYAINY